jgi:uncharacterized protein YgiM (DUF1202 family)
MTTLKENRNIMQALAWFIAACVIAAALLGCAPVIAMEAETPTAAPSMTATNNRLNLDTYTPTPRPACTVTAYALNFRAGPGTRYEVLQILYSGDVLQISLRHENWLKVETAQRVTGWVYGRYCR